MIGDVDEAYETDDQTSRVVPRSNTQRNKEMRKKEKYRNKGSADEGRDVKAKKLLTLLDVTRHWTPKATRSS